MIVLSNLGVRDATGRVTGMTLSASRMRGIEIRPTAGLRTTSQRVAENTTSCQLAARRTYGSGARSVCNKLLAAKP